MGYGKSDTSIQQILTPEQNQLLNKLISEVMPQIGQAAPVYEGQITPEASALQQQAFQYAQQLGGTPEQQAQRNASLERLLSGASAYEVNPAAREAVYNANRDVARNELNQAFRGIEERYNARGLGRSGGVLRALAGAGQDFATNMGQLRAQLEYQDEQARRAGLEQGAQRQIAGQGAYQAMQQGQFGQLAGLLGAGDIQRNIQGQQYGEQYAKWLQGQPYANPWLGFLPQVLGTQVNTPTTSGSQYGIL